MQEPGILNIGTGAGLVALATAVVGPVLGEYSIIVGMGLLGTLIALSEITEPSTWKSLVFVMRGTIFSFVFTGLVTFLLLKYVLPITSGLTPYATMGVVAFCIGWYSNNLPAMKTRLFDKLMSWLPASK